MPHVATCLPNSGAGPGSALLCALPPEANVKVKAALKMQVWMRLNVSIEAIQINTGTNYYCRFEIMA